MCGKVFKMDLVCIFLGIIGLLLSLAQATTSAVFLVLDLKTDFLSLSSSIRVHATILKTAIVVGSLCALQNLLLIVGIIKRRPGLLLFYFGFGIFYEIFILICSLQFLLNKQWIIAFIIVIACLVYMRLLMVVHGVYERMITQNLPSFPSQQLLTEDSTDSFVSQDSLVMDN